jgi:hypothetical protein
MSPIRTFVVILSSISFIIVIGGAVYEHLALVPAWTSAVPASLSVFQGEYRLAPENFWIPVHPITILLLIGSLILNWKTGRRSFILATLVGYAIVLAITFLYFVPELMALTQSAYSTAVDPELTARAGRWETLSLVRLAFLILLAISLLYGLSKPIEYRGRPAY